IGVIVLGVEGNNKNELDFLGDISLMKNGPEIIIFTTDETQIPDNIKVNDIMIKSRVTHDMIISRVEKIISG
ncbi:MAG: hypothetical protein OEW37_05025, partial [Rhodospirillaceae bacterium]|nr:hypothetical protein [Rhodospirillaceae bacterium]